MNWENAVRSLLVDPRRQEFVRHCYFDLPLLAAVKRYHASEEWASVRKKVPLTKCGRALDVGAGNGLVSYALARDGWNVTAVEPDGSCLVGCGAIRQLAKNRGLTIDVAQCLPEDLVVPSGSFDAIFVRQVMHHAVELNSFAARLGELLKPGGLMLTWRDHVISRKEDLPDFFRRHPLHHLYGGENAFQEAEYRAALTGAGLNIVSSWRNFDDPINYGPQTPTELFIQAGDRVLPPFLSRAMAKGLGNPTVFRVIGPLLSAIDWRSGRLVAYLARKDC